ncbi:MAG: class I SAM-dependent methyltransferase [Xenococcaceae cyanobacterium MO_207.B15]|nr:class I SAM-dependent methyltransferase [Xenococcaceae cyanobacterium MO_207.B15]
MIDIQTNSKTSIEYWSKSGNNTTPNSIGSPFQRYFDLYLPKREDWNVIEVGACPGQHLATLSKSHGYKPFAIDFLPAVRDLPKFFRVQNLKNLTVFETDFLNWNSPILFDVTMSYGFIEHFENWEEVILKHWNITNPGGYMVIGVPILSPAQMLLRRLVYTQEKLEELLATHNLAAMDLKGILKVVNGFNDSEIVFSSHIMQMHNWILPNAPYVRSKGAWIVHVWNKLAKFPRKLDWSSYFFSPYVLVIVKKSENVN